MRSAWIYPPNDPDFGAFSKQNPPVTCAYFDARWLATLSDPLGYLKKARSTAPCDSAGIYLCSQGADQFGSWLPASSTKPEDWATWANEMVQKKIAPGTGGDFPRVHLNCETSADWVMAMLGQWRKHQPKRTTGYTPAAHKADLFAQYGAELAALKITILPQCYIDSGRVESAYELGAWQNAAPDCVIQPMLLAQELGAYWYGCAFGSLPA